MEVNFMSDYWYTTKTGRKVHVLEGETPEEAYKRMYHENPETNEPYTMEEEDKIAAAGGLDSDNFDDDYDKELYEDLPINVLTDEEMGVLKNKILEMYKENPNLFAPISLGADYNYIINKIKNKLKDYPNIQSVNNSDIAKLCLEIIK